MPLYVFACSECEHSDTLYRPMNESDQSTICPECGQPMFRDWQAEAAGPHLDKEFSKPIEMHSIAYTHPDDVEAFCRRNPDVKCSTDPADPLYGVPIARTRAEKLRILEREGFEEKN